MDGREENVRLSAQPTLEEKYNYAVRVLRGILNHRADQEAPGYINEWIEAEAFWHCRNSAAVALRRLGESMEREKQ